MISSGIYGVTPLCVENQLGHFDTPYTRLFQWFGLSLFFHIALITLVGGTPQIHQHRPLVVELQHIPPDAADPLTRLEIAPDTTPAFRADNPLPQTPAPDVIKEIAPPAPPKPAVDLPVSFESYLHLNEVDVRAEPINDVPLVYPMAAFVRHISGVVQLNLFINEDGKLDRIDLVGASPKGLFEQAAIDAVSKLYFQPATRYGRAVKSQKTIEVVFDPNPDSLKPKPPTPSSSATEK